jgi:antitoxin ParD1/3/4
MNVSLTPQLEAMIREKVASGHYNNASEVVREALRLMADRDELQRQRLAAAIAVGRDEIARGEGIAWTATTMAEISREADEEERLGVPLTDDIYP